MAILSNDGLDDQLLLDGNDSFVGGQVSSTRANLVPDDAYVEGKNIDLDEFGNAIQGEVPPCWLSHLGGDDR